MTKDIFEKIIELIFFVLVIILVIQVALKLTGHSPTTEAVLTTGLGLVISYLLVATHQIAQFTGRTSEFMDNSKESFRRIREDMEIIREDMGTIKKRLKI